MQATQVPKKWSDSLIELTRSVMNLEFVPTGDFIYLKNINGGFGTIKVSDWLDCRLCVQNRKTLEEVEFASVDDLIAAGWAVD